MGVSMTLGGSITLGISDVLGGLTILPDLAVLMISRDGVEVSVAGTGSEA